MQLGKQIKIFLTDGTATGLREAEIINHTILCVAFSRQDLAGFLRSDYAKKPGIYFLFGYENRSFEQKAYIGEAEILSNRLSQHLNKTFWTECCIVTSKDDNLTKGHIKYLESKALTVASATKRYYLENNNQSQLSHLPKSEQHSMEEFFQNMKLILSVMGHRILEELPSLTDDDTTRGEKIAVDGLPLKLFLNVKSIEAKALQTDLDFIVLKSSFATANPAKSLSKGYASLRLKLINDNILKYNEDRNLYYFTQNYPFTSPSAASDIIVECSTSGPEFWKTEEGVSLKKYEKKQIDQLTIKEVNTKE